MRQSRHLASTILDARILGTAPWSRGVATTPGVTLGDVGRCPHTATCTWLLFDSSGSVSGTHGTDPIARRFDEALLALRAVARRCRCRGERVGITHFDHPTSLDLAPTALAGRGWRRVARSLTIPPDAAGQSLLRPSLEATFEQVELLPGHAATCVVFSDFLLFDDDLPALYEQLASFPGTTHAVCLRAFPPTALVDDPRVTVTHIDGNAARGSVANAVLAGLTVHRR